MLNAMVKTALAATDVEINRETTVIGNDDSITNNNGRGDGIGDGMGDGMTPAQMGALMEGVTEATVFGVLIIALPIVILLIAGVWKTLSKAGQPGFTAIIPFVNWFFIAMAAGLPAWWGLLMLIPFFNIFIGIYIYIMLAQRFGRGAGTVLGLFFLPFIFWPLLGFGSAKWTPPPATT